MSRLPDNLPQILRKRGLKVVEVDGWRTRDTGSDSYRPEDGGVLIHHDAMGKRVSLRTVLNLLIRGRSDLRGPLAQISVGRDGTVYLIAAGRAHHAGKAKPFGNMAGGDGNTLYTGFEVQNDGRGEPYPSVQYDAVVLLTAVFCVDITGNSVQTVAGHKETSITGKIDPIYPMAPFRASVAKKIHELKTGDTPAKEGPVLNNVAKARVDIGEAIGEVNRAVALLKLAGPKRAVAFAQIKVLQGVSVTLRGVLRILPES